MSNKKFVKVQINFKKEVLFKLFLMAHERDVTLNKLVNDILKEYIDNLDNKKGNKVVNKK